MKQGLTMKFLQVIGTSLISLAVLFLLTRLCGNKQVSQLTTFDYINGITIGSIAAEMSTELENPWIPLTAMAVYGIFGFLVSICCSKSMGLRRFLFGKNVVLLENGKIDRENLKRCRMDLSEFMMQARSNGYFDLSQIRLAVMEPSGTVSFCPKEAFRPATPNDLKIVPEAAPVPLPVMMDGKIVYHNLREFGKDVNWLFCALAQQGILHPEQVILCTLDEQGTLTVFDKRISSTAGKFQ